MRQCSTLGSKDGIQVPWRPEPGAPGPPGKGGHCSSSCPVTSPSSPLLGLIGLQDLVDCCEYSHHTKDKMDTNICRACKSSACDPGGNESGEGEFSKAPSDQLRAGKNWGFITSTGARLSGSQQIIFWLHEEGLPQIR